MDSLTTLLGPLLIPRADRSVVFHSKGALRWDSEGTLVFAGDAANLPAAESLEIKSRGIILPPFLDCHIHIPQWPIRGRFCEGIIDNPAEGRLLAGLQQNVFPFEGKCADAAHTDETIANFRRDTLSHGVVGGAAYMTVHAAAVEAALSTLPKSWSVGLVMMNMNCPEYLRTDEPNLERDIESLAHNFGRRFIVTDRFAVAVDSPLRRRASKLAEKLGLRTQTHLNEQSGEKTFVEQTLYPDAGTYTNVYHRDGLLQQQAILAHCIHMSDEEFDQVVKDGAVIAHCPTSNSLLGSGIMPLDQVVDRKISYAICTDVGASPTTSILCEMAQFLKVHAGRSAHAIPSEALYRTTLGAAELLGIQDSFGLLSPGRPASFIEIDFGMSLLEGLSADEAISLALLGKPLADWRGYADEVSIAMLAKGNLQAGRELDWISDEFRDTVDELDRKVNRVTIAGQLAYNRAS